MKSLCNKKGFSTLELLIAFAVMTLSMTAVIMVAFGSQSNAVDTELAQRALYLSQTNLENAGVALKNNFDALLTPTTTPLFGAELTVTDISECAKRVESESFWNRDLRALSNSLSMVFTDATTSDMLGGDCATSEPEDEWDNPISYDFADLIQGGSSATDVDIVESNQNDKTYAIITSTLTSSSTLWVADVTDPASPFLLEAFADNEDYNEVDAYMDESTGIIYAYVATASSTAALQAFRIELTGAPGNPINFTRTSYDLNISGNCNGNNSYCPTATAIKYHDNRVYIGTHRTNGNEFQVFQETTPGVLVTAPVLQKEINHNINEIGIAGGWAYLATSDDSGELIGLSISGNSIPDFDTTKFNAPGNNASDGISLHVTSQYTFLGRVRDTNEADLFVIRNSALKDTNSITDGVVAAVDMDDADCRYRINNNSAIQDKPCLAPNTEVRDIVTSGNLAFIVSDNSNVEFQVWNISDITNPHPHQPETGCSSYNFPAKPTALDYHDNLIYASIESNVALRIIYDQPGQCVI